MHVSSWEGGPTYLSLLPLLSYFLMPLGALSPPTCVPPRVFATGAKKAETEPVMASAVTTAPFIVYAAVTGAKKGERDGRLIFVSEAGTITRKERASRRSAQRQLVAQAPVGGVASIIGGSERTLIFRAHGKSAIRSHASRGS